MRIFIGTEEIASVLSNLSYGFRELGHDVTTYVKSKNKFYHTARYNIVRQNLLNDILHYTNWKILPQKLKYYLKRIDDIVSIPYLKIRNKSLIKNHDIFVFIWHPWLDESYLFPLLKKKGKKIICIHLGSDVRHITAFEQEYKIDTSTWESYFHTDLLDNKIKRIRYHELYADLIYSVPDQAGLYLRNYNHFPLPLDEHKKIICKIPARKNPLIIHAPSRVGIKGTPVINEAIARLQKDGFKIEYQLIQDMPNEQLLKVLSDADILCDELYLHGPGMLSAEAMASGTAVATRCLNLFPFQPPVCAVTPENLYDKLKELILDIDYRVSFSEAGKKFVDDFNNPVKIARKIIEDLNNGSVELDYKARFFIEKYQLPKNIELTEKTKSLTRAVIEKYGLEEECSKNNLKNRKLI